MKRYVCEVTVTTMVELRANVVAESPMAASDAFCKLVNDKMLGGYELRMVIWPKAGPTGDFLPADVITEEVIEVPKGV